MTSDLLNAPKEFLRLFKAGKEAARSGQNAKAHDFFRQAIEIDPYHEQVWLWLASVVETDEDRRVCFENVLELNPAQAVARLQLHKLEQNALTAGLDAGAGTAARPRRRLRRVLLFLLVVAAIVAALIAWGVI